MLDTFGICFVEYNATCTLVTFCLFSIHLSICFSDENGPQSDHLESNVFSPHEFGRGHFAFV